MKRWWFEGSVLGWEGYKFTKKLKYVNEKLKVWNFEVFGNIRVRKRKVLQELDVDKLKSEGGVEEYLLACKVTLRNDLDEIIRRKMLTGVKRVESSGLGRVM